jgi:hypothetical protein
MEKTDWKGNLPPDPDETTIAGFKNGEMQFGDLKIGLGNFYSETYTDTEGNVQTGLRCGFWLLVSGKADQQINDFRVYAGMVFDYLGYRIRVHRLVQESDGQWVVEAGVKKI